MSFNSLEDGGAIGGSEWFTSDDSLMLCGHLPLGVEGNEVEDGSFGEIILRKQTCVEPDTSKHFILNDASDMNSYRSLPTGLCGHELIEDNDDNSVDIGFEGSFVTSSSNGALNSLGHPFVYNSGGAISLLDFANDNDSEEDSFTNSNTTSTSLWVESLQESVISFENGHESLESDVKITLTGVELPEARVRVEKPSCESQSSAMCSQTSESSHFVSNSSLSGSTSESGEVSTAVDASTDQPSSVSSQEPQESNSQKEFFPPAPVVTIDEIKDAKATLDSIEPMPTVCESPVSRKRSRQVAFPSVEIISTRFESRVGRCFQADIPPLLKRRRVSSSPQTPREFDHDVSEERHLHLEPVFNPHEISKTSLREYIGRVKQTLSEQQEVPPGKTVRLPYDTFQHLADNGYDVQKGIKSFDCKYRSYVDSSALSDREKTIFSRMARKFRHRNTGTAQSPCIQKMFGTGAFDTNRQYSDLVNHYFQHEYVSDNDDSESDDDEVPLPRHQFASKSPATIVPRAYEDDEDSFLSCQMRRPR